MTRGTNYAEIVSRRFIFPSLTSSVSSIRFLARTVKLIACHIFLFCCNTNQMQFFKRGFKFCKTKYKFFYYNEVCLIFEALNHPLSSFIFLDFTHEQLLFSRNRTVYCTYRHVNCTCTQAIYLPYSVVCNSATGKYGVKMYAKKLADRQKHALKWHHIAAVASELLYHFKQLFHRKFSG